MYAPAARDGPLARLLRRVTRGGPAAFTYKDARRLFQVREPGRVRLRDYDPRWTGDAEFKDLRKDELKARAEKIPGA